MTAIKIPEWIYNPTGKDVMLYDLKIKLKAGAVIDIFKYNPDLAPSAVLRSLHNGYLKQAIETGKTVILEKDPSTKTPIIEERFSVSKKQMPWRAKCVPNINTLERNFVEQLEAEFLTNGPQTEEQAVKTGDKFISEVDLDGFSDPLINESD